MNKINSPIFLVAIFAIALLGQMAQAQVGSTGWPFISNKLKQHGWYTCEKSLALPDGSLCQGNYFMTPHNATALPSLIPFPRFPTGHNYLCPNATDTLCIGPHPRNQSTYLVPTV